MTTQQSKRSRNFIFAFCSLCIMFNLALPNLAFTQSVDKDDLQEQMTECNGTAGIIFINKEALCAKLLNPLKPTRIQRYIKKSKKVEQLAVAYKDNVLSTRKVSKNCSLANEKQLVLSGYYIVPSTDGPPFYNPINSVNSVSQLGHLYFFPVWNYSSNNGSIELITLPIKVTQSYHTLTANSTMPVDLSGVLLSASLGTTNLPYDHDSFQYNDEAMGEIFKRAFISYYGLSNIINNCDYLGITGALINTGRLVPQSYEDNEPENLDNICPNVYFTYRFIGFKKAEVDYIPVDQNSIGLKKANVDRIYKENNGYKIKYKHSIPTEMWAAPCPPMWHPE